MSIFTTIFPLELSSQENNRTTVPAEREKDSFFRVSPPNPISIFFQPLDDVVHKPFTVAQFLCKKSYDG